MTSRLTEALPTGLGVEKKSLPIVLTSEVARDSPVREWLETCQGLRCRERGDVCLTGCSALPIDDRMRNKKVGFAEADSGSQEVLGRHCWCKQGEDLQSRREPLLEKGDLRRVHGGS